MDDLQVSRVNQAGQGKTSKLRGGKGSHHQALPSWLLIQFIGTIRAENALDWKKTRIRLPEG